MRVRLLSAGSRADEALGLSRLGIPSAAREYLLEKLSPLELLVTRLTEDEARLLRRTARGSGSDEDPTLPLHIAADSRRGDPGALLCGRLEHVRRLIHVLRAQEGGAGIADALESVLRSQEPSEPFVFEGAGGRRWELGARTALMGVVNVTPDSFFDGGRYHHVEPALARGVALAEAGADLLDVGGESTRPGAAPVTEAEELERVVPVVRGLRQRTDLPISIDTRKALVAEAALDAGASMVNDISALTHDAQLASVVARRRAALCVMHMQGTPATMQEAPFYEDVVEDVLEGLEQGLARAEAAGISRQRVWVDPGIGFGKTAGHNLFLLRRLGELRVLGRPVLVGTSRKAFLGKLLEGKPAEERLFATLGSIAAIAAQGSADMVRVHDVREAREALAVVDAIRQASEGGPRYR